MPLLSRDVCAGLFLLLFAAAAYFGIRDLPFADATGIGPGLMPKSVAALIAALGLVILVIGLPAASARLERFSVRGPLFVLGSVLIFASLIRPLGLVVAGPLAVLFAGAADRESRPFELVVFSIILSAFAIGLFKYLLRLPMPLAPFFLGY
jgi:putative tricarboxylic transport membrane protein